MSKSYEITAYTCFMNEKLGNGQFRNTSRENIAILNKMWCDMGDEDKRKYQINAVYARVQANSYFSDPKILQVIKEIERVHRMKQCDDAFIETHRQMLEEKS